MTVVSAPAAEPPTAPGEGRGHFFGDKWEYRRILWGSMPALIVTLGLYRFWVTTNIRRYLWSRTDFAGQQIDYNGNPFDLLLGFLVIIVLLAPVMAIIGVFGFLYAEVDAVGSNLEYLPLLLLIPLAVLALYQARRYRLNHTVFRGLCFRQTGSAWVYSLRVAFWTIVVAGTLGLAYPWARADLERYKMRNTYYGDLQGSFEGSASELFKRGLVPWLASLVLAAPALWAIGEVLTASDLGDEGLGLLLQAGLLWLVLLALVFYPIFRAIVVRWRIAGMRFGTMSFEANFPIRTFAKPYAKFYGWMLLLATVVGILSLVVQFQIIPRLPIGQSFAVEILGVVGLVIAYFAIATIISFAFQGTVRFENWRLILNSLVLRGVDQLERVKAPAASASLRRGRTGAALNLGGF